MEETNNRRLILNNFLSIDECKELEFIHKSCSTVGYRPNVLSTTPFHLIATNCAHLLLPFVPIRERLKEKVEEFFGCEYELCIEFTGLISWLKGASIGWHSDDNRPYLAQRDYTAVCYLNSYGSDFNGGLFHFQDGKPGTITPSVGDVAIYTADSHNIHSVDEISDGERLTLTLWFSRDSAHDEDAKLISLLSQRILDSPNLCLPLPASSNMYWFSPDQASQLQSGFNICCARLNMLGFDIYVSTDNSSSTDISDIMMEPIQLLRGNELFRQKFINILHALQVVQFYSWKPIEYPTSNHESTSKIERVSQAQHTRMGRLKSLFVKDAEGVFGCATERPHFNWSIFSDTVSAWEDYTGELYNELLVSLPYWKTNKSLYCAPFKRS